MITYAYRGGVLKIRVSEGQVHLGATWKDDNLWVENYDPATKTCHFRESSRGKRPQGQVTIQNCNPMRRALDANGTPTR